MHPKFKKEKKSLEIKVQQQSHDLYGLPGSPKQTGKRENQIYENTSFEEDSLSNY